ncbi:MAG: hypothetical protein GX628_00825 [Clostridiales bacterium]|nr:hypothetical protein [Clostridiales bacterium]
MKIKTKVGLLPLYLKLYDDTEPDRRVGIEAFHALIANSLTKLGIEVVNVPVCRVKEEFDDAVSIFERDGVDAIFMLCLAYSPSLESSYALARTSLPIIVLNTTPDSNFDWDTSPVEADYNHGITGVQDICNMLLRSGKHFEIFSGHHEGGVLNAAAEASVAARMARLLKTSRVGVIGDPFKNMGDFQLGGNKLRELLGIETVKLDLSKPFEAAKADDKVKAEYRRDCNQYNTNRITADDYALAAPGELALRAWIRAERLNAFTLSYITPPVVNGEVYRLPPPIAAGKAMRDGIGYAGEGDAITAALTYTLLAASDDVTFTEVYCPDWQGGTLFLRRFGELNPRVCEGRASMVMSGSIGDMPSQPAFAGVYRHGEALLVSLSPLTDDRFGLIVSPGELSVPSGANRHSDYVCGRFKPSVPIEKFLSEYSRLGGIHHSVLVYGLPESLLKLFAAFAGFEYRLL